MKVHNKTQKYLKSFLDAYSLDWHSLRMRALVGRRISKDFSPREILVEADQPKSNQLALSIFLPVIKKHFDSQIVFYGNGSETLRSKLKTRLRQFFSPLNPISDKKLIFQDCGIKSYSELKNVVAELYSKINDCETLEILEYRGVLIGDLIYDTYLRRHAAPTVILKSAEFRDLLEESIKLVDFWYDYLSGKLVSAICISHCVYLTAIPARVALNFGIEVFQVNTDAIYRVTSKFPHAYTDFINYKQEFQELPIKTRETGINQAKERLRQRFSGDLNVDMPYMSKSAFIAQEESAIRVIKDSSRFNVLIAIHDFFDSPHVYGPNFYPDFLIWLQRLDVLSYEVDYDWYIKTHPEIRGNGHVILEEFVSRSNGFMIVPPETSHHQLIKEGIDCVLTVYGTIGMEYPYLGKAAINASRSNPHVGYNFSITPEDKFHYESTIRNLSLNTSKEIKKEEIEEYYFMHKIYNLQNWVFLDQEKMLKEIGGYDASNTSSIYTYFRSTLNRRSDSEYLVGISEFLNSTSIRITRAHFDPGQNL